MKLGAFTCWLSDRPLYDALIEVATDELWWRVALDNEEGRLTDAALR